MSISLKRELSSERDMHYALVECIVLHQGNKVGLPFPLEGHNMTLDRWHSLSSKMDTIHMSYSVFLTVKRAGGNV